MSFWGFGFRTDSATEFQIYNTIDRVRTSTGNHCFEVLSRNPNKRLEEDDITEVDVEEERERMRRADGKHEGILEERKWNAALEEGVGYRGAIAEEDPKSEM